MNAKNDRRTVFAKLSKIYRNPLFILTAITVGITIYLLIVQIKIGVPYWDVFNYLNNALYFMGTGVGGVLSLPPFLPLLTSIFFRMGLLSVYVIFILTSIIFVIGVIGLYLLLKERFNPIQSFTACIIFISFPVVMSWAATGGIDIPSVSFSIWAIYFTVVGVKKDSRFLYLVLPFVLLAVLTRYTAGLILIPILLYLLMNKNHIKNLKKIILAAFIEFLALTIAFMYFYVNLGTTMSIFNLFISITSSSYTGMGDVAYNTNVWYYLQNTLNYLSVAPLQGTYQQILNPSQGSPSVLSYITAFLVVAGLTFYLQRIFTIIDKSKINFRKLSIILLLIIIFIITFNNTSFLVSEVLLLGILYLLYLFLDDMGIRNIDLDIMFLSWFGTYLIFQSILPIKVDRYFITMAPAIVYFIILGLKEFIDKFEDKITNKNLKPGAIYVIVALLFLSSAIATNIGHLPKQSFTVQIGSACNWLAEYDSNYKDKVIYSDYPPAATWYLKKIVYGGFPRDFKSIDEFSNTLIKDHVDYYIDSMSNPKPDIKGYHIIKIGGRVAIYEKDK